MITIDTLVVVLLALIAAALLAIAFLLFSALRVLTSQRDPVRRLRDRSQSNLRFLSSPQTLHEFVLSEAAIQSQVEQLDPEELEAFIRAIEVEGTEEAKRKVPLFRKGWEWIKAHKGKIGEKLFDKLNDIAKGFIPGASKE